MKAMFVIRPASYIQPSSLRISSFAEVVKVLIVPNMWLGRKNERC